MALALLHYLHQRLVALRDSWRRDSARHLKLTNLFQPGGRVRSARTGRSYHVESAQMCYAILRGPGGDRVIVDWLTPGGSLRLEVADNWDPDPLPAAKPLHRRYAHGSLLA